MRRLLACLTVCAAGLASAAPAFADFGLKEFDFTFTKQDGSPQVQAGSHPFALSTMLMLNQKVNAKSEVVPDGELKDFDITLPVGLVGDRTAIAQCPSKEFFTAETDPNFPLETLCPDDTAVGVAAIVLNGTRYVHDTPVYNLAPPPGVAAEFGFSAVGDPVVFDAKVSQTPPYQLKVSTVDISQAAIAYGSNVVIWGNPYSPAHDALRGKCLQVATEPPDLTTFKSRGTCPLGTTTERPFLTLPRSCSGPLLTTWEADSWQQPGSFALGSSLSHDDATPPNLLGLSGCDRLGFAPTVGAQPTSQSASSPSGLNFTLDIDDEGLTSPTGTAQSDIEKAVVALPEGMTVNPALAEGIRACSEADLARETLAATPGEGCPSESKIGTVEVETPLLEQTLKGSLYLATPYANPFGSLIALYVVVKDPETGILLKLPGEVRPNQASGQLVSIFDNLPQLPFSHFRLRFREGQRSPLATPPLCGTYETSAELTPWANPAAVLHDTATFQVTSGVGGGPCPAGGVPPFSPTLSAGTSSNAAGSYSPLELRIARKDGEQEITGFSTTLPEGLIGSLTGIPFCAPAQIAAAQAKTGAQEEADPSCPSASLIGQTSVGVGVGSVLAYTPGKLYLAGPYEGAPFSVVDITAARVGPFDLGTVVVHLPLQIDPVTAQVSIPEGPADQIPHIIDGIVVHVRDIRVLVNRPDFTMNPTSCAPTSLDGTIFGSGASFASASDDQPAAVSDRFQAADCRALSFEPGFTAATKAKHTRRGGAYLHVTVRSSRGQANVHEVHVELPKALPSVLKTLQKACTASQFEKNPAGCPPESVVGHAVVHTPVLPVPLTGPAYFVSHGGQKFPELTMVLQGYGVKIVLAGETFISKAGITSSTFKHVPDVPFTRFDLTLPAGPHSALAGFGNFCKKKLSMPTRILAQNGARVEKRTTIAVEGCKPAIYPLKHKAHGSRVRLVVQVPSAGTLTATGRGIAKASKRVKPFKGRAKRVALTIHLTHAERAKLTPPPPHKNSHKRNHHHGRSVKLKVHLSFKPRKGHKLKAKQTLRLHA